MVWRYERRHFDIACHIASPERNHHLRAQRTHLCVGWLAGCVFRISGLPRAPKKGQGRDLFYFYSRALLLLEQGSFAFIEGILYFYNGSPLRL